MEARQTPLAAASDGSNGAVGRGHHGTTAPKSGPFMSTSPSSSPSRFGLGMPPPPPRIRTSPSSSPSLLGSASAARTPLEFPTAMGL
eukprot:CAMPEP_0119477562 /NCGR_PEP_ID=MMETSP1344-20130328/7660_1 /TAXON_ID=236787 /ORGANISM="Florenciella parvula, Strain CCMP2471" /LENGTH=86 /DNA_ID=CAMNT_0007511589 /DNA_START=287 /DNA_END=548 /DNA_ORIENTATION=-